jgi:hypothetical protein
MYLTLLFHSLSAHFIPFFLVCTKLYEAFGSPTVLTMFTAAPWPALKLDVPKRHLSVVADSNIMATKHFAYIFTRPKL